MFVEIIKLDRSVEYDLSYPVVIFRDPCVNSRETRNGAPVAKWDNSQQVKTVWNQWECYETGGEEYQLSPQLCSVLTLSIIREFLSHQRTATVSLTSVYPVVEIAGTQFLVINLHCKKGFQLIKIVCLISPLNHYDSGRCLFSPSHLFWMLWTYPSTLH